MGSPWLAMAHQGSPLQALATHGLAMAHTKACLGTPWHTPRHDGAGHGLPWAAHGQAMAQTNAFFEEILGLWTRYFAHMLRKIKPSSLPSFTFFEKKNIFF
jgi:hypothetical protein